MLYFEIGDVIICWDEEGYHVEPDGYMANFLISGENLTEEQKKEAIRYKSRIFSPDEYEKYELLMENIFCKMYNSNNGKILVYPWIGGVAMSYRLDDLKDGNEVVINFDPGMQTAVPMTADRLFSIIGLHSMLFHKDALILHASYIEHEGKAILFTAPSQTGKSTQASLWQKYVGAEIINGDRVLVRKRDGVWHAYGFPCCGSSNICVNKTLPIEAIVILEQGKENQMIPISVGTKIRSLVTASEVFVWHQPEIGKAFELAEQLVEQVTVCKLSCRPDEGAVQVLKEYLEGNL